MINNTEKEPLNEIKHFLNHVNDLSDNIIIDKIQNSLTLSKIFQPEFYNQGMPFHLLFNLFKKDKKLFNLANQHYPDYLSTMKNEHLMQLVMDISYDLKNKDNKFEEYCEFLSHLETIKTTFKTYDYKKSIVISGPSAFYEMLTLKKEDFIISEKELDELLPQFSLNNFKTFLKLKNDFFLEYCQKKNSSAFSVGVNKFKSNLKTNLQIIEETFKNHPSFNKKEWLFDMFEYELFQKNTYERIPTSQELKTIIINALQENPEFLDRKVKVDDIYVNLKEQLKIMNIQSIIKVINQIENEKKIKTEVIPNISKKALKQSRF